MRLAAAIALATYAYAALSAGVTAYCFNPLQPLQHVAAALQETP